MHQLIQTRRYLDIYVLLSKKENVNNMFIHLIQDTSLGIAQLVTDFLIFYPFNKKEIFLHYNYDGVSGNSETHWLEQGCVIRIKSVISCHLRHLV